MDIHAPSSLLRQSRLIQAANYPNQQKNYYQVTWEPSLGWADSDANFVAMYQAAYDGIHSTDPNAVVMGTGNPFAALGKRAPSMTPVGVSGWNSTAG